MDADTGASNAGESRWLPFVSGVGTYDTHAPHPRAASDAMTGRLSVRPAHSTAGDKAACAMQRARLLDVLLRDDDHHGSQARLYHFVISAGLRSSICQVGAGYDDASCRPISLCGGKGMGSASAAVEISCVMGQAGLLHRRSPESLDFLSCLGGSLCTSAQRGSFISPGPWDAKNAGHGRTTTENDRRCDEEVGRATTHMLLASGIQALGGLGDLREPPFFARLFAPPQILSAPHTVRP